MPYLHLPFQSGADRILAAMNRKHTARDYLDLVDRIRAARPDIALSTDVIVGFPGETEAEFEATLGVFARLASPQAYSFKYSPRPGTPAAARRPDFGGGESRAAHAPASGCSSASRRRSMPNVASGERLPVLFERPAGAPGSLSAARPTCSRCTPKPSPTCSGASCPLKLLRWPQ